MRGRFDLPSRWPIHTKTHRLYHTFPHVNRPNIAFLTRLTEPSYLPCIKQFGLPVCWLVGCLTSQQHASVSQGRICSGNFASCHTEIEVADQTFYLTQSQYTDTGLNNPSTWQGSHWSANFEVTGMTRPRKNPGTSRIRTRDLPLSRRTP